eukprot:2646662-Alexandrium_andersonii.AAC.1
MSHHVGRSAGPTNNRRDRSSPHTGGCGILCSAINRRLALGVAFFRPYASLAARPENLGRGPR